MRENDFCQSVNTTALRFYRKAVPHFEFLAENKIEKAFLIVGVNHKRFAL